MQTVSILIPAYNAETWIEAAVWSALYQVGITPEVVVVDDGSTDRTMEILKSFGSSIRLHRGGHAGGNAARNRLLQSSSGPWVQFLDADDYLSSDKIARQLDALSVSDMENCDVIYSPVVIEKWEALRKTAEYVHVIDPTIDIYTQWILWQMPQTGGCLWRRAALEKIGSWNEKMPCCQEHELYFRALRNGLRFCYVPLVGAHYRNWSNDTVSRRDIRQVITIRTELIREFITWLEEREFLRPEHLAAAGRVIFEMARTLAQFSLPDGAHYFRTHQRAGMIALTGPAAPWNYRIALPILGFRLTERLAAVLR